MSKTITIPKGIVTSVNDESGILTGTNITILNTSKYKCFLTKSATEPAAGYTDTRPLNKYGEIGHDVEVATGSLEIWAYSDSADIILSIEEI
jgi:hypothetical protein